MPHAPGGDLSRSQLIGRHPPFVDRVQQLWWLERTFGEVSGGEPRLVFLSGEAGIGKTRLVREFGWITQQLGAQLCIGRSHEGASVPYLPICGGAASLAGLRSPAFR